MRVHVLVCVNYPTNSKMKSELLIHPKIEFCSKLLYLCFYIICTSSPWFLPGCGALRDVAIDMPQGVRRGQDVRLSCKYDLEGDALYAVKWYKGSQEFYRYLPKEVPAQKWFLLPGIQVDVSLSDDHDVVLRHVPMDVTGSFRCVVSAESTFQTLEASAYLTVVVIGDDRPSVESDRTQYHPGDLVLARCRTPSSSHPHNITWFINDKVVPGWKVKTDIRADRGEGQSAKWVVSSLSYDLPENVTPVRIKCRAQVFSAYDQNSTTLTITPQPRRLSGPHTLLRSKGSRVVMTSPNLNLLQVLLSTVLIALTCAQSISVFNLYCVQ